MRKSLRTQANYQMRQSQNKKPAEENDFESRRALLLPPNWLEETFFKIFQLLNNFLIIGQKQVQRIGKLSFLKVVKLQLQHYYETKDWNIKNRDLKLNLNAQFFLNNRASEKIRILSTCAGSMLTLCDSQWPSGQNCLLESLEWSCRTRQVTSYWGGKQLLCQRTV